MCSPHADSIVTRLTVSFTFSGLFLNSTNKLLLPKELHVTFEKFSLGMNLLMFIKQQIIDLWLSLWVINCISFLPLGFGLCKAARGRLAHYHSRLQSGCLLCLWPPEGGNTLVKLFQSHLHALHDRELFSQKMCISHTKAGFRVKDRTSVW